MNRCTEAAFAAVVVVVAVVANSVEGTAVVENIEGSVVAAAGKPVDSGGIAAAAAAAGTAVRSTAFDWVGSDLKAEPGPELEGAAWAPLRRQAPRKASDR